MVATLILHVGPHKTGTTALQRALAANEGLLARHGVLYPQTGRNGVSHSVLGERILRGDLSQISLLVSETAGWRAVLLSSEHLSAVPPAALVSLRDAFPKAEFRVAYCLRSLGSLWPSHWAELVKHGQDVSFQGYLDRVAHADKRPFYAPIRPLRQLDTLAEVFGLQALRLSSYDQMRADGQDVGPSFIDDLLGLGQIASAFATPRANPSPSTEETVLTCLMNRHAGSRANHQTKRAARTILLDAARAGAPWLPALQAALDRTRRIAFGSDHPLVRAEQEAVIARYGHLVPDGSDAFCAPISTVLPDLDDLQLDAATSTALVAAFDAAFLAVKPDWQAV